MMNFRNRKRIVEETQTGVRPVLLQQARKSGALNLANKSLKEIPDSVWTLNMAPKDSDSAFDSTDNWWDQVQLSKLILSSNQLKEVSESIGNFKALITLDVHDNELAHLPQALAELTLLEKLDASHNHLQNLPSLSDCTNILVLLLQHNNLSSLPSFIANLKSCEKLDASHNNLSEVSFACESNLKYLNLSHNSLKALNIGYFISLRFVDLSNNQLTIFPEGVCSLSKVEQLYLRNNSISSSPSLENCASLKELYMGNNKLAVFPENLPKSISILELRDNKITTVPGTVIDLQSLERLDLGNNNVSGLPPEMGNMSCLKVVVLDGNPLRSIRRDVISRGTQAVLAFLRSRIVTDEKEQSSVGTQSLPQSPFHKDLSRKSEVSNSGKLHAIKQEAMEAVKTLDDFSSVALSDVSLTQGGITDFPIGLHQFKNSLSVLNLSGNKIKEVPAEIGGYTTLTHLNLGSNNLQSLPPEMSTLQSLIEINFVCNRITELPLCLFEINSLENILGDDNQITHIPANELLKMDRLSTLSLKNNCIKQVPPELALIKNLRTLVLEGNTFRIPRQSILQKGSAAVLEYLRSRLPNQ
uniref:Leucine-rich repeat-containing protein 40-like n=1 Tax=Phallusia mammillata TaxID=59560 RepID=A0A6F9DJ89_9ASCI|nr:leucine-rich repeat-containing protein 40-like [Phallusia mammillata]